MVRSKTIKLFLPFGQFSLDTGYMECCMPNWVGTVCRVQRHAVKEECVFNHETLKRCSVYVLIGEGKDKGCPRVYVGQASIRTTGEAINQRLREHVIGKNFWDVALVITTSGDSHHTLGATELNYLESRLYDLVVAGNNAPQNEVKPSAGNLSREQVDVLEEFVERVLLIASSLGFRIFEPARIQAVPVYTMVCKYADGRRFEAQLREKEDGTYELLEGSMIALPLEGLPSLRENVRRERLKARVDAQGKLLQSLPFSSPSAAATYVLGCSGNGRKLWRMNGKPLGEIKARKSSC